MWYRYPSIGLPVMYVLVVTHLFSCVEMEVAASFLSLHAGRLHRGSCLALKPLVSHLRHASQVIPIRVRLVTIVYQEYVQGIIISLKW